jgi:acyl-CoA hydrolase
MKRADDIARELVDGTTAATGHYVPTNTREALLDAIAQTIREARAEAFEEAITICRGVAKDSRRVESYAEAGGASECAHELRAAAEEARKR